MEKIEDRAQPVADDAGLPAVAEWVKAQPHETYDGLKRQFYSLKCMLNSMGTQLSFYMKKSYETGEQHLAALQESLESERAMNAALTEELALRQPAAVYDPNLSVPDNVIEAAKTLRIWEENHGHEKWQVMGIGPVDHTPAADNRGVDVQALWQQMHKTEMSQNVPDYEQIRAVIRALTANGLLRTTPEDGKGDGNHEVKGKSNAV